MSELWCIGRNYAEHAKELGNEIPSEPLIFLKSGQCMTLGHEIRWPEWAEDVHHEIELAFKVGTQMQFSKVALALDLTERKKQNQLKSKGQPWTLAKSFLGSAPFSDPVNWPPSHSLASPSHAGFSEDEIFSWPLILEVNGELRQKGSLSQTLFKPEIIKSYVKKHFPLHAGDWILTGTPSGVASLKVGDQLRAQWGPLNSAILNWEWTVGSPLKNT